MVEVKEDNGDGRIEITKDGIVLSGDKAVIAIVSNNPGQVELAEYGIIIETNELVVRLEDGSII